MPVKRKDSKAVVNSNYDDARSALAQARRAVVNSGSIMRMTTAGSFPDVDRLPKSPRGAAAAAARSPVSRPAAYGPHGTSPTSLIAQHRGYGAGANIGVFPPGPVPYAAQLGVTRQSPSVSPRAGTPATPRQQPPQEQTPDWGTAGPRPPTPGPSSQWWTSHSSSAGPASLTRGAASEAGPTAAGGLFAPQLPPFPSAFESRTPSSPVGRGSRSSESVVRTYSALQGQLTGARGPYHGASVVTGSAQQPAQQQQQQQQAAATLSPTVLAGVGGEGPKLEGQFVEGASTRNRPLLPETIRDAVHMYLESSGRHDVVVAMLRAEREAAPAPTSRHMGATGASGSVAQALSSPHGVAAHPLPGVSSAVTLPNVVAVGHADERGGASPRKAFRDPKTPQETSAIPHSFSVPSFHQPTTTTTTTASPASPTSASPPLPVQRQQPALPQESRRRKAVNKRSHDLLKRALLERNLADHAKMPADVVRGSAANGLVSSYVLPTLYGLEESVQPDLVLLYSAIEEKLLLQYAQLGLPPPPLEVRRYLVAQTKQPMWSAADVADATFLPSASNPATGNVLYGTVNQLVEELTRVYVLPLATTPERLVTAGQHFQDTFFRQHRLFLPSSVLLAKLMERFFVPCSLKFHPENFSAHGITVHAPGDGSSVPLARSQGETVHRKWEKTGSGSGGGKAAVSISATTSAYAGGAGAGAVPTTVDQHRSGHGGGFSSPGLSRHATVSDFAAPPSPGSVQVGSPAANPSAIRRTASGGWVVEGAAAGTVYLPPSGGMSDPSNLFPAASVGANAPAPAAAAAKQEVPVKLITHYSKCGSLWLMICERVQVKVLTVILQWLMTHPSHFDADTIHCLLHFLDVCCYSPSRFSDCPAKFPQIAEFIRMNCYGILRKLKKNAASRKKSTIPTPGIGLVPDVALDGARVEAHQQLHHHYPAESPYTDFTPGFGAMTLCSYALDERKKAFEDAVPPPLRHSHPAMHTWRSLVDVKEGDPQLPLFILRHRDRPGGYGLHRFMGTSSAAAMGAGNDGDGAGRDGNKQTPDEGGAPSQGRQTGVPPELERARRALELFAQFSLEEYVKGLTAAHQTLFSLFPAPDLLVAALHTTANFQTSKAFQRSYLGIFLQTSTELTQWATSLLLHASLIDGERRDNFVRQATIAAAAAAAAAASSGTPTASGLPPPPPAQSLSGSVTHPQHHTGAGHGLLNGNNSLYSMFGDSCAGVQNILQGNDAAGGLAALSREMGDYNELGDDDDDDDDEDDDEEGSMGNTMNSNTNAGLDAGSEADAAVATAAALRRSLSRLPESLRRFSSATPARCFLGVLSRIVDLVVGFLRVNNLHASYSVFRSLSHPFIKKLLQHPSTVAHMDPRAGHQLRRLRKLFARPEHMAQKAKHSSSAAAAGDVRGGGDGGEANFADAHQDMTLGEYMKALSDNAEFPTIPAVLYYLRELQRIHATEPTFLTGTLDEIYPRGEHGRHARESTTGPDGTAITRVCIVHWRKLRMIDEIVQTVSALQTAALYYISSRATVVRFAAVNVELERAFAEQLAHTIVDNVQTQQEMANRLLATL